MSSFQYQSSENLAENNFENSESDENQLKVLISPLGFNIFEFYQIDIIIQRVLHKKIESVALQFPDEWLKDAIVVLEVCEDEFAKHVESLDDQGSINFSPLFFILSDSTNESEDIDVIGGMHLDFDLLVHFGATTIESRILFDSQKVMFIEGVLQLNFENLIDQLDEKIQSVHGGDSLDGIKIVYLSDPWFSSNLKSLDQKMKNLSFQHSSLIGYSSSSKQLLDINNGDNDSMRCLWRSCGGFSFENQGDMNDEKKIISISNLFDSCLNQEFNDELKEKEESKDENTNENDTIYVIYIGSYSKILSTWSMRFPNNFVIQCIPDVTNCQSEQLSTSWRVEEPFKGSQNRLFRQRYLYIEVLFELF